MIQSHYPVWNLPRDVRQKLRAAGIKATDLAAWSGSTGYVAPDGVVEPRPYTYKAKPRWSKARKARAAFRREYPDGMVPADGRALSKGMFADLSDVIFNITPTATPFFVHGVRDPGHSHGMPTCMICGELGVHQCAGQPASADPARPVPDGLDLPARERPPYLDETGKGASAARAETDIMDALRAAVKENW